MEFTWRARAVVLIAAVGTAIGVFLRQEPTALAGLAVLIWLGLEWANFRWRTLGGARTLLVCRRLVEGQARRLHVLVTEQDYLVEMAVDVAPRLKGLRCWIEDVVPRECLVTDGSPAFVADLRGREALRWKYLLRPVSSVRGSLPGCQVVLSDLQGLFRVRQFLPLKQELTILPLLVRPRPTVSVLKQQNVQMLPGVHRHLRAGFSTELLGIRDYRTGDPPRHIAWKATARLGRLMTCEFESEVPIRATIIADLSVPPFSTTPGTSDRDRVLAASASIARLLIADRDPVGGLVVSASDQHWLRHGLGERHLSRWLMTLTERTPLPVDRLHPGELTEWAWTTASRRFPELFDEDVNPPRAPSFRFGRGRRQARQRRQLSFVLAELYARSPGAHSVGGGAVRLQFDDLVYRELCRRFLEEYAGDSDHSPLILSRGWERDEGRIVETICRGLLAGTARASDNELFVIVGPIPLEAASIDRLEAAVRLTRAQHHRVLMVDVGSRSAFDAISDPLARRIAAEGYQRAADRRFAETERRLGRLGARAARLEHPRLLEKVMAEIEILKSGRLKAL